MVSNKMGAPEWLRKHLEAEASDLLREMVHSFAERSTAAEVDVLCNAGYGEVTPERTTSHNGYRSRTLDTRGGHDRPGRPKTARGQLLPGLAPRAAPACRACVHGCGIGPGRLHPARRRARAHPRHRIAVQEPGLTDG
jgi:hypothetical protein